MNLNNITINIPQQLQKEGFGFIKLKHKSKVPFEKEWQKNPYNLEEADTWLRQGGNYGVMGGHGGLVIIDADANIIKDLVETQLPPTFTVKSRANKRHFYYICPEIQSKIVLNDKVEPVRFLEGETHYGEIISYGAQVVGPHSIHPDTNAPYEVVNDIEIARVSKEDIFSALAEYLPDIFNKKDHKIEHDINLSVFDVLQKFGISTEHSGKQLQISHPIHGSTNNCNFAVDEEKNVWHCFRHSSGGGVMILIAMLEGIIDCSEALAGKLRGKDFIRAKEIACEKYGLSLELSGDESEGGIIETEKEVIDVSQFSPMSSEELIGILGLTIKHDAENKLATFLCELSAYTESSQFNISYNAPSSTGKSYIPTEIARLFPQDDVLEIAYCSPTAFFHDVGQYNKDKNSYLVDLSHKILIFLDQPHNDLLARLRPLLSHDKKEIIIKITDKTQKNGTKTKNIILRGFPSVIFCTASLRIDEQEATRFLLLSPEVSQDKIQQGISAIIRKEADSESFVSWLEENPDRMLLKERIRAIKLEDIKDINIESPEKIEERFLNNNKTLKPRHQRDIKRLIALIKSFAILNVWWRERNGSTITANEDDINEAFKLWGKIAVSQELNLPPYIYNLYKEIILPAWEAKNIGRDNFEEVTGKLGISRQEVLEKHFAVYGRMLDTHQLRQQILPMLETAGLIIQEQDPTDKRKMMIFPASTYKLAVAETNSEVDSGIKDAEAQDDYIINQEIPF